MAKEHLLNKPHHVDPCLWWYEENDGMFIVVRHYNNDDFPQITGYKIRWSSIRAALKRKDK